MAKHPANTGLSTIKHNSSKRNSNKELGGVVLIKDKAGLKTSMFNSCAEINFPQGLRQAALLF